ncbi:MAG TPA: hypothetical protein VFL82_01380 [Thermomicrobiales bacterium]|nr:hypothetical protein [Thermomicrobiales bacterium]
MEALWFTHLGSSSKVSADLRPALEAAATQLFPLGHYPEGKKQFTEIEEKANVNDDQAASTIARLGVVDADFLDKTVSGLRTRGLEPHLPKYMKLEEEFGTVNDPGGQGFCLQRAGWIQASLNNTDEADKLLQQARERAEAANDQYVLGYVYYGTALVNTMRNNFDVALADLQRCEMTRRAIGDEHGVGAARIGKAKVNGAMTRFGTAVSDMESADDIFRALNNQYCSGMVATHMAALATDIQTKTMEEAMLSRNVAGNEPIGKALTEIARFSRPKISDLGKIPERIWPG